MAIAATFTPRGEERKAAFLKDDQQIWPQLDAEGKVSEAQALDYDPVLERFRRMYALEIGPRQRTDLAAAEGTKTALELAMLRTIEQDLPGGKHYIVHSETKRAVELTAEEGDTLTITVSNNTRVFQVQQLLGQFMGLDEAEAKELELSTKAGAFWRAQLFNEEVASRVKVRGVKNFTRPRKEYRHPIMVLGAGIGGMVTAMKLLHKGRTDIQMFEKLHDFGGGSWYHVANQTTKLQTEAGSYHLQYYFEWLPPPTDMPTWPSRDQIISHFQRVARQFGLDKYCAFNTKVTKIQAKGAGYGPERWYAVHHEPADGSGDGELAQMGACLCWPGNLSTNKLDTYPGEDDFGGYIEYASLNKPDFTRVPGKDTVIIGHGAFAIENVRTCLEVGCRKIVVLCRRRNITAPKVVSWMVTFMSIPMPGPLMMDAIAEAYKLIGWDPWTAYSVVTDARRSYCRIEQGTMFGVTDVYFLAGYYGIMDVVVGEVKRLSHHCVQTKSGEESIHCEVLLKTVGIRGDPALDKVLGLRELVGFWVNGDPLFPCITNTLFVQASNFTAYSIGPGIAGEVESILWFVDYPQDFEIVRDSLPVHNKESNVIKGNSLYVYTALHATMTQFLVGSIPGISAIQSMASDLKWKKQRAMHPIEPFLKECRAEWAMYVEMCSRHPVARKDVAPPAYPYTREMLEEYMRRSGESFTPPPAGT